MNKIKYFIGWQARRTIAPRLIKCRQIFAVALAGFVLLPWLAPSVVAQSNTNGDEQVNMSQEIGDDEVVQLFRTAAVYQAESDSWRASIRGWVYEPQQSRFRKAIFSWALNAKYNLQVSEDAQPFYERRLNLLIADNERGKQPVIHIAGEKITAQSSTANGHFSAEVVLPNTAVAQHRKNDILPVRICAEDGREFHGELLLLKATGLSVISDIDDTIKISEVLDHQRLIDNTFLKPFRAVPGMSEAYRRLNEKADGFHFVSSSPWQLYPPLQEFADAAEFPPATFSLKSVRFRDMTLFDLFKPGTATKPRQITQLLARFPGHRFILVGDSGEQDPEVYAQFVREMPNTIAKVFIRNITNESLDNQRFKPLVEDADKWQLFEDPADIQL